MGAHASTGDLLKGALARLRELVTGLTMPTMGGCVCNPVAWERDARIRISEREAADARKTR
jgi:hypothetical protein